MATMGIGPDESMAQSVGNRSNLARSLLASGILSSLLYVATDLLGGTRYDGYSFFSQAVSELAAVGAPTQALVVPLFLLYGLLVLLFGIEVFREGGGENRALRASAAFLIGYAVVGFTGFTLFPMQQRGFGSMATDLPHIVVTVLIVLLLLLAIGFGAFALGTRFCMYSFGTALVVIGCGALTAPYAFRLAAGQPTPGFGLLERIDIYAFLLWVAVFAIGLLQSPSAGTRVRQVPTARSGNPGKKEV